MSYTAPMPFETAVRRAGAEGLNRDDKKAIASGHHPPAFGILLRHCARSMRTVTGAGNGIIRYWCATCGTSITHIDGHGAPAPLSPRARSHIESSGELWSVATDPRSVDAGNPGATSHHTGDWLQ